MTTSPDTDCENYRGLRGETPGQWQVLLRRAGEQCFPVQVGENEPRAGAKGQSNFHKRSGSRVTRFTGNDLENNRSLLALPYPQLFTRVAVGQAGLAEHGMLIGDALGWCFVDLETGFQQKGSAGHVAF